MSTDTLACGYFDAGRCHSCTQIRTPYADQLAVKHSRARAAVPAAAWLPPVASELARFRTKAKMVVGGTVENPTLGILDLELHGVDLAGCPILDARLVAAFPALKAFVTTARLKPYDVPNRRGELKHLLVTVSPSGELMVRFVLRSTEALSRIRKHLPALQAQLPDLAVATVNLLPAHAALIEGDDEIVLTERATLPVALGDVRLELRPRSFFQTNTAVATALYATAREWAAGLDPSTVWDLYCGVGGFARHLAAPGRTVVGVELSADAVAGARAAAGGLAEFVAADATAWAGEQSTVADLVVVNPPRRGIGPDLASWLEGSGVRHVLYSSCQVDSLARDLTAMPSLRPARAQVFDMFAHTEHFETLVLLTR